MKVPEELVEAAKDAALGGRVEMGFELRGDEIDFDAALQAVLPKVRGRLLSDEALVVAGDESSQQHHFKPYDPIMRTLIEAAFDHAFPEEES